MANKSVKITFDSDLKGLKKALADAKASVKDFGKDLKGVSDQLKNSMSGIAGATDDVTSAIKRQLDLEKQRLRVQSDRSKKSKDEYDLAKKSLSELARVTKLGGVGDLLMLARNPLALAATVAAMTGVLAAREVFSGARQYEQGAGSRVLLQRRGFGANAERGDIQPLIAAGMSPDEARQALLSGANTFGRNLAIPGISAAVGGARQLGVGLGAVTGAAETIRGAAGNTEAFRMIKNAMGAALAENLENPESYLKSISGLISGIAQDGLTLDAGTISHFANMLSKTGFSPESLAKTMQGIDAAIKGSAQAGGERAAFFQSAAFKSGAGRGTIGGARLITQFGLGQINTRQFGNLLTGEEKQGLRGLGADQSRHGFVKAIVDQLNSMLAGTKGKQRVASEAYFMEKFFGIGGAEGLKALGILRQLSHDISPTRRAELERKLQSVMPKSPEERLIEQQAQRAMALERIGESSRNALLDIRTILTNVDRTIGQGLSFLGFKPKSEDEAREQKLLQSGAGALSDTELYQERASLFNRKAALEMQLGQVGQPGESASLGQRFNRLVSGESPESLALQLVQVNKLLAEIAHHGKETSKNTKNSQKSSRTMPHHR